MPNKNSLVTTGPCFFEYHIPLFYWIYKLKKRFFFQDIFVSLCTVDDSMYFMCNIDDFKFLADMIEHVPLPLRARYVFCCAPINRKLPFVCTMFLKFARQFIKNESITFNWLCLHVGWPMKLPKTLIDLVHLEAVFDVLDLYLWLRWVNVDVNYKLLLFRWRYVEWSKQLLVIDSQNCSLKQALWKICKRSLMQ